jgi:hypothetical protein
MRPEDIIYVMLVGRLRGSEVERLRGWEVERFGLEW